MPPAGPVHLAVDGEDLGALIDGGKNGMRFRDLTELAREVGLLLRDEGLVAKEDHMVRVQRVAHGGDHTGGQCHREVDVPDFGTDGGREWVHAETCGEGHAENCARDLHPPQSHPRSGPTLGHTMAPSEGGDT